MRTTATHFPSNDNLRSPFMGWILFALPPCVFVTAGTDFIWSQRYIFGWVPFGSKIRTFDRQRIFRRSESAGTIRTATTTYCPIVDASLPFMPLVAAPPEFLAVVGPDLIRRDVSVFGGMPLSREQRMRLGERHKRLLLASGCPGLIHVPHATAAAPPLPTKLVAPLQGAELFSTSNPGRRSPTRFALGYYLSGFQPFEPACISVNQRLRTFAVFAPWRLCVN
jgi:hypothetical protein